MKRVFVVVLAVLAAIAGGLTLAAAHDSGRARGAGAHGMMGRMSGMMQSGVMDMMGGGQMMGEGRMNRMDARPARAAPEQPLEQGKAVLTPEQRKNIESLRSRPAAHASGGTRGSRGFEEMQRLMQSEQMPQAMAGMMEMARRVGNGDPMAGMVRMTEMMGAMGGDGGGMMSGFPGYPAPEESR
jgi:hypothetical protein